MNNNFLRTKFKEIIFLFLSATITFFLLLNEVFVEKLISIIWKDLNEI